jgi:nucleoside-diphosphate-sugar epimerase
MSTFEVYKPQMDPHRVITESDPLGDANSLMDPTYSISKFAQEAVARACARAYDLPVVIARMNASYGGNGGLLAYHLDWILSGTPVMVKCDPAMYSPIHEDDIFEQTEALLHAASVPATVVNWCGDEPTAAQEWCAYMGELVGVQPNVVVKEVPGGIRGIVGDVSLRTSLTGPCKVPWRVGVERLVEQRQSSGAGAVPVFGQSSRLLSSFQDSPTS